VEYSRGRKWSSVADESRQTVKRLAERVAFAFYRAMGEDDKTVLDQFAREERVGEAINGLAVRLKGTGERLASSEDRHRASSAELYDAVSPHLQDLLGRLLSPVSAGFVLLAQVACCQD
jgi:hypothetical protein